MIDDNSVIEPDDQFGLDHELLELVRNLDGSSQLRLEVAREYLRLKRQNERLDREIRRLNENFWSLKGIRQ